MVTANKTRTNAGRAALAAIASAALLLAGCAQSDVEVKTPATAEGALEQTSVKFGILPTPDYVAIQIALDQGFFEDEGIAATTEVMSPGGAIPAVLGGSLDVVGVNWVGYLQAVSQGIEISAVAEADRGGPGYAEIMVLEDSPIKTLADLDGKKVGVVVTPGNCDQIPLAALANSGSDAQPDFVTIAIPDMPGNVQRGGIDAACVPEPTLSAMKAAGGFRSINDLFSGDYEQFPIVGFTTSEKYASANPNTVAAVKRALQKATDLARTDPDIVRVAILQYTQIPEAAAANMTLPSYPEESDFSKLQIVVDVLGDTGLVPNATIPGADK
ncbi:ABC transporter substrate-binding protein [Cryobacterium sp. Y50]|uniref:ABC transporter substrate-binding protein n=1 Tax=Cryobacterium sp. Y50 TaxID=2048286 RepID=UPI000CE3826B|nr:ABC transporter substrate-binding protein [Cryobacterium sp. Y50]